MGQFINLSAADGLSFPAYVAEPAGKARGAVVVLQEIFGVNSHIRAVADGYAADGYLAVAPAAFHRVKQGVELGYTADDMGAGIALKSAVEALPAPGVMADIEAAVAYASRAGKVGVVGYCWGGFLTWVACTRLKGFAAGVSYYGGGIGGVAAEKPGCPVQFHFGEKDHAIPMTDVARVRDAGHRRVEVHVYPAGHGFNCDERGSFDAASARQARARAIAFFAAHVAGEAAPAPKAKAKTAAKPKAKAKAPAKPKPSAKAKPKAAARPKAKIKAKPAAKAKSRLKPKARPKSRSRRR